MQKDENVYTTVEGAKITVPDGAKIDENGFLDVNMVDDGGDLGYKYLPLETLDNLMDIEIDPSDFQLGVDSMSYAAGQITCLTNVGLTPEQAVEFLLSGKTMELQEKLTRYNVKKEIEVARIGGYNSETEKM